MTSSIYLIGGPGSGKSTLMDALTRGWVFGPYERLTERELFGHHLVQQPITMHGVYLGHRRPEYPGTDALSLSVAPQALNWLETLDPTLDWVFGEGARLAHSGFLAGLANRTRLLVVHLRVDPEVSEARRAIRPGKPLTPQYCKTAVTKSANTAAWCREVGITTLELEGTAPVEDLLDAVSILG